MRLVSVKIRTPLAMMALIVTPMVATAQTLPVPAPKSAGSRLPPTPSAGPPAQEDPKLDVERQRLALERQKLELEREKFLGEPSGTVVRSTFVGEAKSDGIKNLLAAFQSVLTCIAVLVGGWWTVRRFARERENHPHVEFTADILPIEERDNHWIVELVSFVENKGKVLHRIEEFSFDLWALYWYDGIVRDERYGNQVMFPHEIQRGSWMPARARFFFIEPNVKAKYSFIAAVPKCATSVILHSNFRYCDPPMVKVLRSVIRIIAPRTQVGGLLGAKGHTAECTISRSKLKNIGSSAQN